MDYRFLAREKDQVIDVIRTELGRGRNDITPQQLAAVSYESGVSVGTLRSWLFGDTMRPLTITSRAVLEAVGLKMQYVRDDGSTVRAPKPAMKSKKEIDAIIKKDIESGRRKADTK